VRIGAVIIWLTQGGDAIIKNMKSKIIEKLKKSGLKGRGGAGFPVWLKWQMIKDETASEKYIICNGAEGDPNTSKDGFILNHYPEEVVDGIKITLEEIEGSSAYIYLRKDYYLRFKKRLEKIINDLPILLFKKKGGFLAGEETCVCEVIEGRAPEPRIKPPYPVQSGLWGFPTLINNVETLFYISKINKGEYKKERFYSVEGDVKNPGVFELRDGLSVLQILKQTKNLPGFDFFVQSGGILGEILLKHELNQCVEGLGSIKVFNRKKTDPFLLMKTWADFFLEQNCDKCTPCREGVFRIEEMLEKGKIDKKIIKDLFFVMEETSFCALGKGIVFPFSSLIDKLLNEKE